MNLKPRVMTILMSLGLPQVVIKYWDLKGVDTSYLRYRGLKERFGHIYEHKVWVGKKSIESISGTGSTLQAADHVIRALPALLSKLCVKRLVDLGCGDYNWMSRIHLECSYIGVDIVDDVVSKNRDKFGRHNVEFAVLDATRDPCPNGDAVICREVLFHLSFADGLKLLRNVKESNAKYLICTTDPKLRYNADVPSGAWRDLNLEIAPFSFPPPIACIPDGLGDNKSRRLGVWDVSRI